MLIFTFRLHGLIEVTPCGNIAGAMALNRGARSPSLSLDISLPPPPTFHSSSFPSLSTPPPTSSLYRFFIIDLFSALFYRFPPCQPPPPTSVNSASLTARYSVYLSRWCPTTRGWLEEIVALSFPLDDSLTGKIPRTIDEEGALGFGSHR